MTTPTKIVYSHHQTTTTSSTQSTKQRLLYSHHQTTSHRQCGLTYLLPITLIPNVPRKHLHQHQSPSKGRPCETFGKSRTYHINGCRRLYGIIFSSYRPIKSLDFFLKYDKNDYEWMGGFIRIFTEHSCLFCRLSSLYALEFHVNFL